jgi:predicted SpoU family rRNA methylase
MDWRDRRIWILALLVALAIGCGIFFMGGGGASATKAIDDAADEFTGNRAVHQGQELKSQIKDIKSQWSQRQEEARGQ